MCIRDRQRLYGAKPDLNWLREQAYPMLKPRRISHVWGCEHEARHLAERWGCDPDAAAEAGILHDCTKKLELSDQLLLSDKYGIINDTVETANTKLLHAKTGAAVARDRFGVPLEIETVSYTHLGRKGDAARRARPGRKPHQDRRPLRPRHRDGARRRGAEHRCRYAKLRRAGH